MAMQANLARGVGHMRGDGVTIVIRRMYNATASRTDWGVMVSCVGVMGRRGGRGRHAWVMRRGCNM